MVTIVMDTDGCDIGHEALLLKEYNEEVMFAESTRANERTVAQTANYTRDRERILLSLIDLSPALAEVGDSVRILRTTAIPQCP
jgi:hypothetical protein